MSDMQALCALQFSEEEYFEIFTELASKIVFVYC